MQLHVSHVRHTWGLTRRFGGGPPADIEDGHHVDPPLNCVWFFAHGDGRTGPSPVCRPIPFVSAAVERFSRTPSKSHRAVRISIAQPPHNSPGRGHGPLRPFSRWPPCPHGSPAPAWAGRSASERTAIEHRHEPVDDVLGPGDQPVELAIHQRQIAQHVRARASCGLDHIRFHDIRHFSLTMAAVTGACDEADTRLRLRHCGINTPPRTETGSSGSSDSGGVAPLIGRRSSLRRASSACRRRAGRGSGSSRSCGTRSRSV